LAGGARLQQFADGDLGFPVAADLLDPLMVAPVCQRDSPRRQACRSTYAAVAGVQRQQMLEPRVVNLNKSSGC
jgi:hypothetical protein